MLKVARVMRAAPARIYRAFLDGEAMATWRPPEGMRARVFAFDGREGGGYRMAFEYLGSEHAVRGKTSEHADVFEGRFVALVPDARIVEEVDFVSEDPAFAGTMRLTTTLTPVADGTEVAILVENAPSGIDDAGHLVGIESTLANLARFTE